MKNLFRVTAALALALGLQVHSALADNPVLDPIQQKNLSVYFIRGRANPAQPKFLPLDWALNHNLARVHVVDDEPLKVDNRSDHALFVPGGTLLRGGTQDQVVKNDIVVPPYTENFPISTYCIDPFRNTERSGESATTYSTDGSLFPWRMARLNLIDGSHEAGDTIVRRLGVWWSIDTLRSALSVQLGEAMEPAHTPIWQFSDTSVLGARRSPWTTGLVLALQNPTLAKSLVPYLSLASNSQIDDQGIIGAAFVINGHVDGVEIYQTHELFRALWPRLLRAYSIEALALRDVAVVKLPTAVDIERLVATTPDVTGDAMQPGFDVRDSDTVVAAGLVDAHGAWIHRSLIPLPDPSFAATAPEAVTLQILRTRTVQGLALADFDKKDDIVIRHGDQGWNAEVIRAHKPDTDSASATARVNEIQEMIRQMLTHGADQDDATQLYPTPTGHHDAVSPSIVARNDIQPEANGRPDAGTRPGTAPVQIVPQNILSTREGASDTMPVTSLDPVLDLSLATVAVIVLFGLLQLLSGPLRTVCHRASAKLKASAMRSLPTRQDLSALPLRAGDLFRLGPVRGRHRRVAFADALRPSSR